MNKFSRMLVCKATPIVLLLAAMNSSGWAVDDPKYSRAPGGPVDFEPVARAGKLVRIEKRNFEPGIGELDLRAALKIPSEVALERRSGFFLVPELKFPEVRIDRIYRMDRNPSPPSDVSKEEEKKTGYKELDAGGGEAVWENGMVANHLMIQTQPGVEEESLNAAMPPGFRTIGKVTEDGVYLVSIPTDGEAAVERALKEIGKYPNSIAFAEPDFLVAGMASPNEFDSSNPIPWYLNRINAPAGWDVRHEPVAGNPPVLVAVLDTGLDFKHPDLTPNIWTNLGEFNRTVGFDDDSDGLVDDVNGWNFYAGNATPQDDAGHGTHVAGILGAKGDNNFATNPNHTCGVCWGDSTPPRIPQGFAIVPVKMLTSLSTNATPGVSSDAFAALTYINKLSSRGVRVVNHSWGCPAYDPFIEQAINQPQRGSFNASATYSTGVTSLDLTFVSGPTTTTNTFPLNMVGMTVNGPGIVNSRVLSATFLNISPNAALTIPRTQVRITLHQPTSAASVANPETLTLTSPSKASKSGVGVVHVAAAGNSNGDNDALPVYPANYISGFILSVGGSAKTSDDRPWTGSNSGTGSNFGATTVDLFAPAEGIVSTMLTPPLTSPSNTFELRSGTSMAAPQVSGALALLFMNRPDLTDVQARQLIIDNVDKSTVLTLKCVSGGRLNLGNVLKAAGLPPLPHGVNGGTMVSGPPGPIIIFSDDPAK